MKRERLRQNTESFKGAIESQINDIKDNAIKYSLRGLIFAGFAVASYFTFRFFNRKADESQQNVLPKSVKEASNGIVAMILSSITSFLLAIAKEQLTNYLEKQMMSHQNEKPTDSL